MAIRCLLILDKGSYPLLGKEFSQYSCNVKMESALAPESYCCCFNLNFPLGYKNSFQWWLKEFASSCRQVTHPQHKPDHPASTFGILLARRVDSSSLVVLRLSSLRLEGEEGMPRWASSSMSSWLCRLGSRGKRWLFLSDQFPTRRDWLLGFEGSCRNKNSLSSSPP